MRFAFFALFFCRSIVFRIFYQFKNKTVCTSIYFCVFSCIIRIIIAIYIFVYIFRIKSRIIRLPFICELCRICSLHMVCHLVAENNFKRIFRVLRNYYIPVFIISVMCARCIPRRCADRDMNAYLFLDRVKRANCLVSYLLTVLRWRKARLCRSAVTLTSPLSCVQLYCQERSARSFRTSKKVRLFFQQELSPMCALLIYLYTSSSKRVLLVLCYQPQQQLHFPHLFFLKNNAGFFF